MVEAGDISNGDMVRWGDRWYVVGNVVAYYNGTPADVLLMRAGARFAWVPVTELTGLEKRGR